MENTYKHWPPTLSNSQLEHLKEHALDYALANGLIMRPAKDNPNFTSSTIHAPFALFPSPYPRQAFEKAYRLQPIFNKLVHCLSQDAPFIQSVFDPLSKLDDFTCKLYDIWKSTHASYPSDASGSNMKNSLKNIQLGIHRSDYMLHCNADSQEALELKQVEINTVAASFASLSSKCAQLHKYLATRHLFFNESDPKTLDISPEALPDNDNPALDSLSQALYAAWKLYNDKNNSSNHKQQQQQSTSSCGVILMVVQPSERNVFDQRWLEYALMRRHGVELVRLTLTEIYSRCHVDPLTQSLKLMGEGDQGLKQEREVSVVYFRSGYGPGDYPSELEWDARLMVEQSVAIKCPSVAYQLIGAKKVQQIFSSSSSSSSSSSDSGFESESFLRKYLTAEEAEMLQSCFAGIYPLDSSTPAGLEARQMALTAPSDKFVMKPQREGGGNNFYGAQVAEKLQEMSDREIGAHILMERIHPPPYRNCLVRAGSIVEADVVSELGVYGLWLSDGSTVLMNESGGHLLRTKGSQVNEGGVAAGFAVIDSPLLF